MVEGKHDVEDVSMLARGISNRFDDLDTNHSGCLDRDELEMASKEGTSAYLRDAAVMLLTHFDDATQFASTNNVPHKLRAQVYASFEKTFASDKTTGGISKDDLHVIELIASESETKQHLAEVKEAESLWAQGEAVLAGGLVLSAFAFGIAPTGVSQVVSLGCLAGAGYSAFRSAQDFLFSNVPRYETYMRDRRKTLADW